MVWCQQILLGTRNNQTNSRLSASSQACSQCTGKSSYSQGSVNLRLSIPIWYCVFFWVTSATVMVMQHNSSPRFEVFDRGEILFNGDWTNLELAWDYIGWANWGDGNNKIYRACLDSSWVIWIDSYGWVTSTTMAHISPLWLYIWICRRLFFARDGKNHGLTGYHLGGANTGNGTFNLHYAYLDSPWFYASIALDSTVRQRCHNGGPGYN